MQLIQRSNDALVHSLADYRNEVIHERVKLAHIRESWDINELPATLDFKAFLPHELALIVQPLLLAPTDANEESPQNEPAGVDLHDAAEILVNLILETLTFIVKSMRTTKDGEHITVVW